MNMEIFSVFDSAAKAYLPPFHAPSVESAIRSFRHTVNNGENDISRYPEDYALFWLGSFDQEAGIITALDSPQCLGVAITFLEHGAQLPLVRKERPDGKVKNAS